MAQRGRIPIPTAIKILQGNPGKRPLNQNEPKPIKRAPKCPTWISSEAKKEWRRMCKQLEIIGTIVKTPSGYCQQVPLYYYSL